MSGNFDPYYTWLGVPPAEQPADFYRLLGLKQFEENREVISHAADQRMGHVRTFQNGPHARDSQRVLNELAKAAGCLLNPRRKAMYDQHLRSSQRAAQQEQALSPPGAATTPQISVSVTPTRSNVRPPRRTGTKTRKRQLLMGLSAGGAALAVIVVAAILMKGSPSTTETRQTGELTASTLVPQIGIPSSAAPVAPAAAKTATPKVLTPATGIQSEPDQKKNENDQPSRSAPASGNPENPAERPSTDFAAALASLPSSLVGKPKALKFAGTDRVEITNSRGLIDLRKPFTVETWVRFAPGDYAHWICGDLVIGPNHPELPGDVVAGWQLFIQHTMAGRHRVAISTREGYAQDFLAQANAWHHIALCNDSKQVSIFVDGRRTATGSVDLLMQSFAASPISIHIGSHGYLHASQPPGLRGDVKAFRVSSAARYSENFAPAFNLNRDDSTEVLLDFENGTATRLPDLSGHGRHGTILGATWIPLEEAPALASTSSTTTNSSSATTAASLAPAAAPPIAVTKQARPDEEAIAKAREQVRSVFKDELAKAKEPKELLALAEKLLALAAESQEDAASRFAMLDEAQRLAVQSGDLRKALSVIDEVGRYFDVNVPELKSAAVKGTAELVKAATDRRSVAEVAIDVADELVFAGRFDLASDVIQTAMTQAGRAKEVDLNKIAREVRDEINQAKKAWTDAQEAQKQLANDSDNRDLNLRWGRFLCFHQRNWDAGLPHLAKCANDALAGIAKLELERPQDPEKQSALGLAWAEALKVVEASEKPAVLLRALDWSRRAEPQLKGLAKAEVEKRIKELEEQLPNRYRLASKPAAKPSSTAAAFQPPREFKGMLGRLQSNGADASVLWRYEAGLRLSDQSISDILLQANVVRGKVRMEFAGLLYVPEPTTVTIAHSGGSPTGTLTLFVDNQPIGEVGGMRPSSDVYKLELNAGEHPVRWILFGDDLGTSSLVFTNAANGQPLVLYHTPQILALVRDMPTRARLNVNMLRNP